MQIQSKSRKLRLLLRQLGHLEFLRFGLRDRIIRFFHSPDEAEDEKFCTDFFGRMYPGNLASFLDWSVFYYGAYAKDELTMLGKLINIANDGVILDIGANEGHHSLFFSTFSKQVHAFEPFVGVSRKLEEKIQVNNVECISLHKVALGEKDEEKLFFPSDSHNTGTGSFTERNTTNQPVKFHVFKGDDYLLKQGIAKIGLIKIDVEGFEIPVLKGLKATLEKERPIVFFEWSFSSNDQNSQENKPTMKDLFPENYDFYRFCPAQPRLVLLSDQHPRLEKPGKSNTEENRVAIPKELGKNLTALF